MLSESLIQATPHYMPDPRVRRGDQLTMIGYTAKWPRLVRMVSTCRSRTGWEMVSFRIRLYVGAGIELIACRCDQHINDR